MIPSLDPARRQLRNIQRPFGFTRNVLHDFRRNQGFLLAGALAYYTLLSIVPMSILALTVLSQFISEAQLVTTLSAYLELVIPGYASTLAEQVKVFIENRHVIGLVGFVAMLFFSSFAFTVLENAISVIFFHHVRHQRRRFLVSALIPFAYFLALSLGIVLATGVVSIMQVLENRQLILFGTSISLAGTSRISLQALGIIGEALILTSIYLVMPVVRITFSHALIGGITATVLWEVVRRFLIWYYASLSMVNVIYGSIATVVLALLSIEVAAIIILLGAQVIAELKWSDPEPDEADPDSFTT